MDQLHLRHAFLTNQQKIEVKQSKKFSNTPKEFWWAHSWIENQIGKQPQVPLVVILEAAGIYHQPIIHFLNQQGYSLYVILPNESDLDGSISFWSKKTKKLEAIVLASLGLKEKLNKWKVPVSSMNSLKELSKELIQRKKELLRSTKQLKGSPATNPKAVGRLIEYIDFLKTQIEEIDEDFRLFIEQDYSLQKSLDQMSESQGINKITLATLIAESDGYVSA